MKKHLMIAMLLLIVLVLSACQKQSNTNENLVVQNKTEVQKSKEEQIEKEQIVEQEEKEHLNEEKQNDENQNDENQNDEKQNDEKQNEEKLDDSWKSAYRDIIRNIDSNLVDPYNLRAETNEWFYLGIHDFDRDNVPELILGDGVSVGIFTYKNNTTEKVIDLYEPEEWAAINGLHYNNNSIVLRSDGSNGSCYVCFTHHDGNYVTGFYDEYNPKAAKLNDEDTTYEEFSHIFDITDLLENSRIPLISIKVNNSNITVSLSESDADIELDKLEFNEILW